MKFYATSLKYNRVVELSYDECTESWSDSNNEYQFSINHEAGNILPMNENSTHECVAGYFTVEVTDPNGATALFNLHSAKDIVWTDDYYPGLVYDDRLEAGKLAEAGIKRSLLDHSFIVENACYLFNEAAMTSNLLKLEPYGSESHADQSAFEEDYHWKII
ncbi:hypothetical protein REH81_01485 [Vibrio rotiferianus]